MFYCTADIGGLKNYNKLPNLKLANNKFVLATLIKKQLHMCCKFLITPMYNVLP